MLWDMTTALALSTCSAQYGRGHDLRSLTVLRANSQ